MAQIYWTYNELLEEVHRRAQSVEVLGHTVDGSPIVAARGGGSKRPAIFITAGSHSTEQAGVSAAVSCIEELETEHQVYVIPTRDPVGMQGFAHVLSLGLGERPEADDFDQVESLLRDQGGVLFEEDDLLLALIGEYGYASARPAPERACAQYFFYQRLQRLAKEHPEALEPLRGRRVWMTPGQTGVAGTGDLGRAYTLIISLDGEILHINRFHDTPWSPIEPRATRDLMARIDPGISFDLHESQLMEDRYFLSARRQPDATNEEWEQKAASAVIQAISDSGATLARDEDVSALGNWFDTSEPGVCWLDAGRRGEGYNLADFASQTYGLAFGTEMGMYGTFDGRVNLAMITVRTAVEVFSQRHA
ncbi:MAG: hypothetical protein VYC64_01950 [Candidatus Latescibacterota bacterium]|nr:hypothetical protein [Candidatus Latescibacterota bacterium]